MPPRIKPQAPVPSQKVLTGMAKKMPPEQGPLRAFPEGHPRAGQPLSPVELYAQRAINEMLDPEPMQSVRIAGPSDKRVAQSGGPVPQQATSNLLVQGILSGDPNLRNAIIEAWASLNPYDKASRIAVLQDDIGSGADLANGMAMSPAVQEIVDALSGQELPPERRAAIAAVVEMESGPGVKRYSDGSYDQLEETPAVEPASVAPGDSPVYGFDRESGYETPEGAKTPANIARQGSDPLLTVVPGRTSFSPIGDGYLSIRDEPQRVDIRSNSLLAQLSKGEAFDAYDAARQNGEIRKLAEQSPPVGLAEQVRENIERIRGQYPESFRRNQEPRPRLEPQAAEDIAARLETASVLDREIKRIEKELENANTVHERNALRRELEDNRRQLAALTPEKPKASGDKVVAKENSSPNDSLMKSLDSYLRARRSTNPGLLTGQGNFVDHAIRSLFGNAEVPTDAINFMAKNEPEILAKAIVNQIGGEPSGLLSTSGITDIIAEELRNRAGTFEFTKQGKPAQTRAPRGPVARAEQNYSDGYYPEEEQARRDAAAANLPDPEEEPATPQPVAENTRRAPTEEPDQLAPDSSIEELRRRKAADAKQRETDAESIATRDGRVPADQLVPNATEDQRLRMNGWSWVDDENGERRYFKSRYADAIERSPEQQARYDSLPQRMRDTFEMTLRVSPDAIEKKKAAYELGLSDEIPSGYTPIARKAQSKPAYATAGQNAGEQSSQTAQQPPEQKPQSKEPKQPSLPAKVRQGLEKLQQEGVIDGSWTTLSVDEAKKLLSEKSKKTVTDEIVPGVSRGGDPGVVEQIKKHGQEASKNAGGPEKVQQDKVQQGADDQLDEVPSQDQIDAAVQQQHGSKQPAKKAAKKSTPKTDTQAQSKTGDAEKKTTAEGDKTNTADQQTNTGDKQTNTADKQTGTADKQASTGDQQTNTADQQTNTGDKQASTGDQQTNTATKAEPEKKAKRAKAKPKKSEGELDEVPPQSEIDAKVKEKKKGWGWGKGTVAAGTVIGGGVASNPIGEIIHEFTASEGRPIDEVTGMKGKGTPKGSSPIPVPIHAPPGVDVEKASRVMEVIRARNAARNSRRLSPQTIQLWSNER